MGPCHIWMPCSFPIDGLEAPTYCLGQLSLDVSLASLIADRYWSIWVPRDSCIQARHDHTISARSKLFLDQQSGDCREPKGVNHDKLGDQPRQYALMS